MCFIFLLTIQITVNVLCKIESIQHVVILVRMYTNISHTPIHSTLISKVEKQGRVSQWRIQARRSGGSQRRDAETVFTCLKYVDFLMVITAESHTNVVYHF